LCLASYRPEPGNEVPVGFVSTSWLLGRWPWRNSAKVSTFTRGGGTSPFNENYPGVCRAGALERFRAAQAGVGLARTRLFASALTCCGKRIAHRQQNITGLLLPQNGYRAFPITGGPSTYRRQISGSGLGEGAEGLLFLWNPWIWHRGAKVDAGTRRFDRGERRVFFDAPDVAVLNGGGMPNSNGLAGRNKKGANAAYRRLVDRGEHLNKAVSRAR